MYVSAVVYLDCFGTRKNARIRLVDQVQSLAYIIESTRFMLLNSDISALGLVYSNSGSRFVLVGVLF
jgi:hypothetical protein